MTYGIITTQKNDDLYCKFPGGVFEKQWHVNISNALIHEYKYRS